MLTLYTRARVRPQNHPFKLTIIVFMKSKTLLISTLFAAAAMSAGTATAATYTWVGYNNNNFHNGGYAACNKNADGTWVYSEFGGTKDWQTDTSSSFPAISKLFSTLGNQLNTLRFVTPGETLTAGSATQTVSTTNKSPSVSFNDLLLGGLIVESGATGYSIVQSGNRIFRLGKENDTTAFDGTINEDFTLTGQTIRAYSEQNWAVASGKTMKFNGNIEGNAVFNIMNRDGYKDTSGTVDFLGNVTAKSLRTGISTVTVHTGKTFRLERIELGDSTANDDKAAKIVVETGAKLLITGSTNDAGNATNSQYKRNTIVLGEWEVKGNIEVKGTFLANKAVVFFGDKGGDVTVAENATMVVNGYGLSCDDRTNSTEQLTVNSGAKLILGDFGLKNKAGNNHPAASITAATIGSFASGTELRKSINLVSGTTTIDTNRYDVDATAGTVTRGTTSTSTITVSGVISGDGGLLFSGLGKTALTAANTFKGGVTIESGRLSVDHAQALGTGGVMVAKGGTLNATVELTNFANSLENLGTIVLDHGGKFTGNFVSSGTLSLTETVTFAAGKAELSGNITLDSGTTVENLKVTAGGNITLASNSILNGAEFLGANLKIGGAAVGNGATTLSGKQTFTTGTIDLSSVSFFGNDLSRVIFKAADDATAKSLAEVLEDSFTTTMDGAWYSDGTNIIFRASTSNMTAWSSGTSKGATGSWTANKFNGQDVGGSATTALPLLFDAVPNQPNVTVNVSGSVFAGFLRVTAGTAYVLSGSNATVNIGEALRIDDGGNLTVNTAMKVDGEGVDIQAGGSLTAGAAGTLQTNNVSLAQGATLTLNHQNALSSLNGTTGTNITMTGGSKISFVQGGLIGADKIYISETSEGKSATLSLAANQPTNKDEKKYQLGDRLSFDAGSHITFDVGENSWLDLTGARIDTSGYFTKTGAGTLVLTSNGNLSGELTIDEGTVALGLAGSSTPIFNGNKITIAKKGTLALIRSNSFSSNTHSATIDVYGKVYIGQDVVYDGDVDIPTQTVNGLTFNLYGGSIDGVAETNQELIDAVNMTVNAKEGYESSMGEYFIRLAGTSIFNVENGATLTVNSTFVEHQQGTAQGFTKSGAGKMILANTLETAIAERRNFTGTVAVSAGALEVQGTLGNASSVTLADSTQLIFNRADETTLSFGGVISGAGTIDVNAGTIHLTNTTNTTGGLTTTGALSIANGAALIVDAGVLRQNITLGGALVANTIRGKLILNEGATIGNSAATNKNVTISGEIDATAADVLTVAGGANLTFLSTTVTGGDLDFVVKESATVNLTKTTAVSDLTIVGAGKVAGTWKLDTLTLVDAGEKTLGITGGISRTATVTVGSGQVAIGANASLNITENSTLKGGDMGLTISGAGTLENAGTIKTSHLTLSQYLPNGGTAIDNKTGAKIEAVASTVGNITIENAGTINLGNATISGNVSISNVTAGTILGDFNVESGKTLGISGSGTFGAASAETVVSGDGKISLSNGANVAGTIFVDGGRLQASSGTILGTVVKFTGGDANKGLQKIDSPTLEGLKIDAGQLAGTVSLVGNDTANGKLLAEIRNNSLISGKVTIASKSTSGKATILMENSNITGSLSILGATANLSNVNITGVLSLQNSISLEQHNSFVENGVISTYNESGVILETQITDYLKPTLVNDAAIGGISGGELRVVFNLKGTYEKPKLNDEGNPVGNEKVNTAYTIAASDLTFDLENADAIGESYALYSGKVVFWSDYMGNGYLPGAANDWTFKTTEDPKKYEVIYISSTGDNLGTIANITFAGGTENLYLDVNQNGVFVKRAGTFVWTNGTTTWSAATWERTQRNAANLTGQSISGNDAYVTIADAKGIKTLSLDGNETLAGLNFRNVENFTLDQDNNKFTGKSLNVESGKVTIKNLGENVFGKAIIGSGATLIIDSVKTNTTGGRPVQVGQISGSSIKLAGTLVFNTDYSSATESLSLIGNKATIDVSGENTSVAFDKQTVGETATLIKTGAGFLRLAGDSQIANVLVKQGILNFSKSEKAFGVSTLVQEAGTNVSVASKFMNTDVQLGADAELKLTNTAADQNLNTLILAKGATLTAGTLKIDNNTKISSTGDATIKAVLSQTATNSQSLIETNSGTLSVSGISIAKNAGLIKSGSGTLKIASADLSGTVNLAGGTLSVGATATNTYLGTIVASKGATLEFTGTAASNADSEIQVAKDQTLVLKSTNDLTFNGKLTVAGTLEIQGNKVALAGTENVYNRIEFNKLTLANGFGAKTGGVFNVFGRSAKLTIAGTTTGNLGSLNLGNSLTVNLAGNSDAQFALLRGSFVNALTVAGTGKIAFDYIDETAVAISDSATVKLKEGKLSTFTGGENAMLEKIGANTRLATKVANNDFAGTIKVSEGKFGFLQGGAFAKAKLEIAGSGEAIIAYDSESKVAIGTVANATTIAKTLTGSGKLTVGNLNELAFAENSVTNFTGTLALDGGNAILNNFSESATVQMKNLSNLSVKGKVFSLKKLEVDYNASLYALKVAVDSSKLTINDFGYIDNKTTGTAGFLLFGVKKGAVDFKDAITGGFNVIAQGYNGSTENFNLSSSGNDIGLLLVISTTADLTAATGTIKTVNLVKDSVVKLNSGSAITVTEFVGTEKTVIETTGDMTLSSNLDRFAGTLKSASGTLTVERDGALLAVSSLKFAAAEGAITKLAIRNDMSQGGAQFTGAGTIEISAADKTLTLNKANADFAGTLKLTAGTLKMTETATLGTGNVELATGTKLALAPENNNANVVIAGSVSGDGTIEKTGGSTAFIGGEVGVSEIVLKSGTLAVTSVADSQAIKFDGSGVLETGKMLNGDSVVSSTGGTRTISAMFSATESAAFSHSSEYGKTTISGKWTTAPTKAITLAGGGEGSTFQLKTGDAHVRKTGTGKWTLTETVGGQITVVAGTLSVQKFANTGKANMISGSGTLEIRGLDSGSTITGNFYGDGRLRIAVAAGATELGNLGNDSSGLILNIASEVLVKNDLSNVIEVDASGTLDFNATTNFAYNGKIYGETGATVKKTGTGTLTLGENYDGEVDFSIDAGTVKVTKSLGSSSKGIVTVNMGAMLEVAGTDAKITKQLAGAGTLKFSSRTTTITAKSDFSGAVEIEEDATIVYSSKNYAAGLGTSNIAGTGTVRVDYTNAAMETDWTATGFAGHLEIKKGTVAITQEKFNALHNNFEIKFTGANENDATLKLSGTGIAVDSIGNLVALDGKAGTLAIDGTATLGGTFGNGVSLRVLDGSALTTSGGKVSANLTIDKGATMTLAAPQTRMARTSTRSNLALLTVGGNLTVAGTMNVETANPIVMNGGNATFAETAQVIFTTLPENDVFISGAGSVDINRNASFTLGDGTVLRAAVNEGAGTLVVGEYIDSYAPAGMSDFAALINSDQDNDIWRAWRQASSGQDGILRNFSPVSFGALTEMTMSVARASNDLLRQRLEQRRYDRAIPMAMMVGTNTFYANGFGGTRDSGESSGENPNYDLNYFGAQAGFDTILSGQAIAGVNLNCATGKADIHANGGKHESTSIGVGFYGQYMFDELTYLGVGARLGFVAYDTKRRTALGEVEGETSGFDMGLSATFGRLFVLDASNGIHFSPYLGLDLDYVTVGNFDETETANDTALRVDSFDRISLRGIAGASLSWVPVPEWRFTLDASVRHEFVGNDSDIDATFQSGIYAGKKSTTTAYYANETSLSVGPRVEYRFNNSWAVNAAYAYETDFEEATSHNANIGLSARF